jgi:hypothetical protein
MRRRKLITLLGSATASSFIVRIARLITCRAAYLPITDKVPVAL